MSATARGWVDPSQWDEGVPAALLNYNLSGSNTWRDGKNGSDNNYYANLQSGLNLAPGGCATIPPGITTRTTVATGIL